MPTRPPNRLLFDYTKTLVEMRFMQLSDGVARETVLLSSQSTGPTTVYTASSIQTLFPTPGVKSKLHSQVVYSVTTQDLLSPLNKKLAGIV